MNKIIIFIFINLAWLLIGSIFLSLRITEIENQLKHGSKNVCHAVFDHCSIGGDYIIEERE